MSLLYFTYIQTRIANREIPQRVVKRLSDNGVTEVNPDKSAIQFKHFSII